MSTSRISCTCLPVQTERIVSCYDILQKAKKLASKKDEGNEAFRKGRTSDAYQLYSEALEIDPNNRKTNAKLFCNRALVGGKVSNPGT